MPATKCDSALYLIDCCATAAWHRVCTPSPARAAASRLRDRPRVETAVVHIKSHAADSL